MNRSESRYSALRRGLSVALAGLALCMMMLMGAQYANAMGYPLNWGAPPPDLESYVFGPPHAFDDFVVANNIADPVLREAVVAAAAQMNAQTAARIPQLRILIEASGTAGTGIVEEERAANGGRYRIRTRRSEFQGVQRTQRLRITFNLNVFEGAALPANPFDYGINAALRAFLVARGVQGVTDRDVPSIFNDSTLTRLTDRDLAAMEFADAENRALPTYVIGSVYIDNVFRFANCTNDPEWRPAIKSVMREINYRLGPLGRSVALDSTSLNRVSLGASVPLDGVYSPATYRVIPGTDIRRLTHVSAEFSREATRYASAISAATGEPFAPNEYRLMVLLRYLMRAAGIADANPSVESVMNRAEPIARLTVNDEAAILEALERDMFPLDGPETETDTWPETPKPPLP